MKAHANPWAFYKLEKKSCSHISTWDFLRTLEKCDKKSLMARVSLSTFLVFKLKLLNNALTAARFSFL